MRSSTVILPQTDDRSEMVRRGSIWQLLLFVTVGLAIGLALSGSTFRLAVASLALLLVPPLLVLLVKAAPQGISKFRLLRKAWRWWHLPWFCLFAGMMVFRIRDSGSADANPLDANAIYRMSLELFVAGTLLIRLALKRPAWLGWLFRGLVGALAVYCMVCVVSTAWSVKPWWTAYKSLEFLADVSLLAAVTASVESWLTFQDLMDWTLAFYGISLMGVWINVLIWPTEAFDGGRLSGVFPIEGSNSIGTSGAVLALAAICRLKPAFVEARDRAWYGVIFLLGMVSMILSQTRNAEAAFVFAIGLLALFAPQIRKVAIATVAILTPFLVATGIFYDRFWHEAGERVVTFVQRDQSAGALDSLSGRTAWWAYGLEQLMHHPLTGIGAFGGRFAVLDKLGVGAAAMMHSDWIEVVIGTSFWGLIPFAAAVAGAWWFLIHCIRNSNFLPGQRQLALESLTLLGMLTLHSFFNNELSWHAPILYFAILGYAEFVRRSRKDQSLSYWREGLLRSTATEFSE